MGGERREGRAAGGMDFKDFLKGELDRTWDPQYFLNLSPAEPGQVGRHMHLHQDPTPKNRKAICASNGNGTR